jgi:hypothetical protein
MADYATTRDGGVLYRLRQAFIPDDGENADWRDYQAWLAAGNVPDELEPDAAFRARVNRLGRQRIQAEMARRCALVVPALEDPAQIDLLAEIWPHLGPTKATDPELQYCRQVVIAARQLFADLKDEPDPQTILTFDIRAWSGWPAEP